MKRVLICFAIFIFSTKICTAQNSIRVGVKGGASVPNLKASSDNPVSKGWSSGLGPYFGVVAEFGLSKRISIQTELNYSSQGGKKNGLQAISSGPYKSFFPQGTQVPPYIYAVYNNKATLNYLELPILAKVEFPLAKKFSFFVDGGFYAGYLLKAKSAVKGTSNVYFDEALTQPFLPAAVSFDTTQNIKDDIKKFNFGIQGGIGLSLNLSNQSKLLFSIGGNYGFIPIQKDDSNGKNNTGAATITLGYLIKL